MSLQDKGDASRTCIVLGIAHFCSGGEVSIQKPSHKRKWKRHSTRVLRLGPDVFVRPSESSHSLSSHLTVEPLGIRYAIHFLLSLLPLALIPRRRNVLSQEFPRITYYPPRFRTPRDTLTSSAGSFVFPGVSDSTRNAPLCLARTCNYRYVNAKSKKRRCGNLWEERHPLNASTRTRRREASPIVRNRCVSSPRRSLLFMPFPVAVLICSTPCTGSRYNTTAAGVYNRVSVARRWVGGRVPPTHGPCPPHISSMAPANPFAACPSCTIHCSAERDR